MTNCGNVAVVRLDNHNQQTDDFGDNEKNDESTNIKFPIRAEIHPL